MVQEPTLIQGNCLKEMAKLGAGSIDMVLTDPPYGTTQCKWDTVLDLDRVWKELRRIVKPNGAIVMTAAQPFTSVLVMSNPKMFKYLWTWKKNRATGFLNAKKQPLRTTEDIAVFYRMQPTYNPQKTTGHRPVNSFTKHTSDGQTVGKTKIGISGGGQTDRYPKNLISVPVVNNDNSNGDKHHPTQKPVALMEYMVKTYTNPGETVLDFTMGSGTTGVACANLGRHFIGIELDSSYFSIACERIYEARRNESSPSRRAESSL